MLDGILMINRYQRVTGIFIETIATVAKTEYSGSDIYILTLHFIERNTDNQITVKCSTINESMAYRGQVSVLYDPTNPMNVELKST